MLKTKCVYHDIGADDGLRILVTRFRGRGMPTDRYDVWMANLGPSEQLLHAFLEERIDWPEFKRRYKAELWADGGADGGNAVIKNHGQKFTLRLIKHLAEQQDVTLMCHCENPDRCHRTVLKDVILSSKV
ncbi:MAG: DUF488 family protein [Thiohalocapsa sp.]|jgi:uncharacterized protein YeaO (DUF488 family)|uniref:DUF488 domain-containing protein n=1 Tax=Thiohalocapsa sp. TaxID=2497641 RepID=UPI0025E3A41F|nr:DUF488 family protein [Thiohalocapsa sp.]MCG6942211.1 DUF488 family protein [Thiohalocapsa sp.]